MGIAAIAENTVLPKGRILFVDDEVFLLDGLRRSFRGEFCADFACGGEEGIRLLGAQGPYSVIVSDMRMPGMDGAQFLAAARLRSPDSIRVLLTGFADIEAAMRAVNEGRIHRFLSKPANSEQIAATLRSCLAEHEIVRRERELLEKTLAGAIRVMTEVLSLANPTAFNKGLRLRQYVKHIAARLSLSDAWQYEIAAMLSELGCLTLTPDLLKAMQAGHPLSPEEEQKYRDHPTVGHDLLAQIPRLELVAEIILRQGDATAGRQSPHSPSEETIRLGAQLLRVSLALDKLLEAGTSKSHALAELRKNPHQYDRRFVEALEDFRPNRQSTEIRAIQLRELRTGMILNENIRTESGILLALRGQEVTQTLIRSVRNFCDAGSLKGTVRVRVPVADVEMPGSELCQPAEA